MAEADEGQGSSREGEGCEGYVVVSGVEQCQGDDAGEGYGHGQAAFAGFCELLEVAVAEDVDDDEE